MRSAGAPTGARVSILPPRVLKSSIVATCSLFLPQPIADDGVLEGGDQVEGLLVAKLGCVLLGDRRIGGERGAAGFDARAEMVGFDVTQDCRLNAAEGKVKVRALAAGWGLLVCRCTAVSIDAWFDLAEGKGDGAGVAFGGEGVDPGAAGIAEAEELCDLVVGLAGGVVDGATYIAIGPGTVVSLLFCEIEVSVATGDDEGEDGEFHGGFAALARFHEDGV